MRRELHMQCPGTDAAADTFAVPETALSTEGSEMVASERVQAAE
jgi:hypothetical protein